MRKYCKLRADFFKQGDEAHDNVMRLITLVYTCFRANIVFFSTFFHGLNPAIGAHTGIPQAIPGYVCLENKALASKATEETKKLHPPPITIIP